MKYVIHKDIKRLLQGLRKRGGQYQLAAKTVMQVLGEIKIESSDPFKYLKVTKHGESRIKKCIKYDLSKFCRLITIQDNGVSTIVFVGTHDECDKWLNANKGLNLAVDKQTNEIKNVFKSIDLQNPEKRIADYSDYSEGELISKLKDFEIVFISDLVSGSRIQPFLKMSSLSDEDEILNECAKIEQVDRQELYFDVFMALKAGKIDEARNRIYHFKEELILVEKAEKELVNNTISNDQYLIMDDFREQDIEILLNNTNWHEWMLFMHPQQRVVVEKDFSGPARLLGVSGSGKTSVIVNRAIRLAKKYPKEKILILTLNRALSKLILDLIEHAASNDANKEIISNVEVKSFWKLCQEMLSKFDPENNKLYNDLTHKSLEDVEEIWDEYYHCEANNDDAKIMEPVHRSLLARELYPSSYIKQEFDWIRSALINGDRRKYLKIERQGRKVGLIPDFRMKIIEGLAGWEDKMGFVGVSDYMGLVKPLYEHLKRVTPKYRCILVDELQDFGTSELFLIRKLVQEAENDIFLSGDIAQQVYTKHHKITQANIRIAPQNNIKIFKNYRNSREILEAAYSVFSKNTDKESFEEEDFELLKPEYANFTSPKPFIRKSIDISQEFNHSLFYLKSILNDNSKGCIAIAGFGYYDVNDIGRISGIPVLNGKSDLSGSNIFISDLEQTKGFEFDRVIIINANEQIIPNPDLPKDEWHREISKIYVAMTRAKKELIISYSERLSSIFSDSKDFFSYTSWKDYIIDSSCIDEIELPQPRDSILSGKYIKMTGDKFLFTRKAIGLSVECQSKIRTVVSGKKITVNGNQVEWETLERLINDIKGSRQTPQLNTLLGPTVFNEVVSHFDIGGFD